MSEDTRLSLLAALKDPEDRGAWGRFAERYEPVLRLWCLQRCRSLGVPNAEDTAAEVAAELVANIHRKMRSYDLSKHRTGGYRAWLRQAALHALSDYRSKAERLPVATLSGLLENAEARTSLGDAVETEFRRELLETVLLPKVRAEVGERWPAVEAVGLADARGGGKRPVEEVAREFGIPPGSLLQLRSRVKKRLRELAQQWEADEHT